MNTRMKVFVINLDRSPDRLARMEEQARNIGFSFERVPAIDGRTMTQPFLGNTFDGLLTPGEVGCYASHLLCCQKIGEQNLPYAMVLEDDATLAPKAITIASYAAQIAPRGWDYIHLSANPTRHATFTLAALGDGHDLVRYSLRPPYNATAYLMSAAGAQKFLAPRHRELPNDCDIRRQWMFKMDVIGIATRVAAANETFESTAEHKQELYRQHRLIEKKGRRMDGVYRRWRMGAYGSVKCAIKNIRMKAKGGPRDGLNN
jgi:glycosyl transferase, family 25